MKDVAGLLHLAFRLAHEVSDASLDMEQAPGLRSHRFFADQIAAGGVSALTHVAAASAAYSEDSSFRGRQQATASLRGAREELRKLRRALKSVEGQHYVPVENVTALDSQADELTVVLTALVVELSGNRFLAA